MPVAPLAAMLAAALFLVIAALHAYWAAGGFWPGRDAESLARTVVGGSPGTRFPGRAATWAVSAVLLVGAAVVLSAAGVVALPGPAWPARAAALAGAAVLVVRGLVGFVEARLRPDSVGSPYARLNVTVYSPLCLFLALLVGLAVRR